MKLSRLLRNGPSAKAIADAAVDACGRVHHIRQAIVSAYVRSEHARGEVAHRQLVQQTAAALKRYFYIVCFASYLQDLPQALTPSYLAQHSFHAYLSAHRELTTLANSLIQGDTIDELLSTPSTTASPASDGTSECPTIDRAVFNRTGAVLGQRCIIKSEYFTHKGEVGQYRGVFDLPLGSTAQPNVAGIRKIIRAITDAHSPSHPGRPPLRLVWVNLREEPVVFLSAEPYLLRDYLHPFRILAEFTTGMTPARSEQIEERLKADILLELTSSSSSPPPHLLVHDETVYRQIKARELPLDPSAVQTTAEVFAAVAREAGGVELRYHRIPLHVEEVVGIASFDRLFAVLSTEDLAGDDGEGGGVSVVFHDQKGGRRVAMGLVIACLIMMYRGGVDLRMIDPAQDVELPPAEHPMSPSPRSPSPLTASPATSPPPHPSAVGTTVPLQPAGPAHFAPPIDLSSSNYASTTPTSPNPLFSPSPPPPPTLHRAKSVITLDPSTKAAELTSTGRGEYKGILSLIRILKRGRAVKDEVDLAIDVAASAYNVRDAIAEALVQHERERTGGVQRGPLMEAVKHAESYAMLIVFNAYLRERKEKEEEEQQAQQEQQRVQTLPRSDAAHPSADADAQAEVIAREKAAEMDAHAAMQHQLERDQEIDAAQITSYDLFNPYISGGMKESDSLAPADTPTEDAAVAKGKVGEDRDDQLMQELIHTPSTSPTSPTSHSTVPSSSSASPLSSTRPARAPTFPTFSTWLHSRPELRLALEFIHHSPEEAFKLNATAISEDFAAAFERRRGNVLVRGSLIKSDHFAGVMNKSVVQLVEGAVNFRPIDGFPVAGTGIPRAEGIANILHFFSLGEPATDEEGRVVVAPLFRASSLLWLNLREEPILYVNHRPFVLRDGDNPYANLENTGITPRRVEAMEKQLKIDAWREAQEEGGEGSLLLHDEDDNGNLIHHLESVTLDSLHTPKEMYYDVFAQMEEHWRRADPPFPFTARYYRTPITDEQAPSPAALDAMIRYLEQGREGERRVVVINCQMGRGRTTTGLIIACLWCLHRGVVSKQAWAAMQQQSAHPSYPPIPDTPGLSPALASSLRAGWYRLISSLMRVLPHGQALKAQVDAVIDHCSAMQNLRSVILDVQLSALTCLPKKRPFFVRRGTNYLLRYAVLIIINAYLTEVGDSEGGYGGKAFVVWLNERPEIMSLLKKVEFPQTDAQRA